VTGGVKSGSGGEVGGVRSGSGRGAAGFGFFPRERSAARVISLAPQLEQVTMLSGTTGWEIGVLHLGQFMARGPKDEYNVGPARSMRRTTPADLAAGLFGAAPGRRLLLLKKAWPAAVGPDLARRSEVVALDGDLLRIRVPDAVWRKSLWRMRSELLTRLRRIAGPAAPHALGFAEGTVSVTSDERAPRAPIVVPRPLPAGLAEAARAIPDAEIRDLFCRTAGRYLGRFAAPHPGAAGGTGRSD
jgi:hypothetical protein